MGKTMFCMVYKDSPFFDVERARRGFEKNQDNLDDVNGFDRLLDNSLFWNVYNQGYVGSIFIYQNSEDDNYYLGGYAERKRHKECVEAVKRAADCLPVVYADTRHLNAVICLKKAGFEWYDRTRRILIRRRKDEFGKQSKIANIQHRRALWQFDNR